MKQGDKIKALGGTGMFIKELLGKYYVNIEGEVHVLRKDEVTLVSDPIVEIVREDLLQRSIKGIEEYGNTLARDDYELKDWLREIYYESLDRALYAMAAIKKIERDEKDSNN